jgi:anaerobic magnesium-protoporphyrin IX monomethyl ester cyclase
MVVEKGAFNHQIRVAIVRPPAGYATGWKPNIQEGLYLLPQALVYLGAAAERAGAITRIFDVEAAEWDLYTTMSKLEEFQPDMIAITTTSTSFCYTQAIAQEIRERLKESLLVMGGSHPTYAYESIFLEGLADVVCLEEGENSLTELIEFLQGKRALGDVSGIVYLDDGELQFASPPRPIDLNEFGCPAYHLVPELDVYRDILAISLNGSRGCPYTCIFCLNFKMYSRDVRWKSVENLAREISFLKETYGIDAFSFGDPTFSLSKKWAMEFCAAAKELDITWACQTRVDLLTDELVEAMAESGCQGILFGVESGTIKTLDVMRKKSSPTKVEKAIHLVRSCGIHVTPSLIMGFPGETKDDILASIRFASYLEDEYNMRGALQFNTLAPFPGTDLILNAADYGIRILPIDHAFYPVVPVIESDVLSHAEHLECWHTMWKNFHPTYYADYCLVESYALSGLNPKLDAFVGHA